MKISKLIASNTSRISNCSWVAGKIWLRSKLIEVASTYDRLLSAPMPLARTHAVMLRRAIGSVETSNFFQYLSKSKSNCSQNYLSKSKSRVVCKTNLVCKTNYRSYFHVLSKIWRRIGKWRNILLWQTKQAQKLDNVIGFHLKFEHGAQVWPKMCRPTMQRASN